MRRGIGYLLVALLATGAQAERQAAFIRIGLKDTEPSAWKGTVKLDAGQLENVEGWMFDGTDALTPGGDWSLTTEPLPTKGKQKHTLPNGLLVTFEAPPSANLLLTANDQEWKLPVAKLAWDKPVTGLAGAADALRAPAYTTLGNLPREDDYPSVTTLRGGDVLAVWQSWSEADGDDKLFLARYSNGRWGQAEEVPGVQGDLYQPAVSDDGAGGYWLVWTQMQGDDYELLCQQRGRDGKWAATTNLTKRSGHDTEVALTTAADGAVWAVWRGYNGPSADIFRAVCRNGKWSQPEVLDGSPANEWDPVIAAGPAGVWAAWDSYRYGSYDVFAARLDTDSIQPVAVAATPKFEAKASIACGPQGEVWLAWQEAGENWGKKTGRTVPQELRGEPICRQRHIGVACLMGGTWQSAPDPAVVAPEGQRNFLEDPRLTVDGRGRVWLAFRRPFNVPRQRGKKTFGEKVWENHLATLDGDTWSLGRYCADRMARQDSKPDLAPTADGVVLVFHTDGRERDDLRVMTVNRVFAAEFSETTTPAAPQLTPRALVEPAPVNEAEAADLARCRSYVAKFGGKDHHLVRGDTHRHTEVSWDGTGDGSLIDAYRYAMDAVALDFFLVTDHNQRTGVDLPYVNWRCYKIADVMHNPGVFTTLFGYERSLGYPNGHRNILQAKRGHPSFRILGGDTDLPQLYDYAEQTDSVLIAHTTGTNHGTDWYAYNRALEPVVEIFQGCRQSYEYEGCPKGGSPGDAGAKNEGYQPKGFLWRAWQRDLRLGIISSSDHGSTHYSYAGVYAAEKTRQGVLDALLTRHTFGSNDNMIVEFREGDHFQGDEWQQAAAPTFSIKILGTNKLRQVDLIRDYEFVYTVKPEGSNYETTWQDNRFVPGTHLYYIRAQQEDESLVWSSPVWIERG